MHRANCRKRVKAAQITTKGSAAAIDGLGCCEKPMHWQTAICALNGSWNLLLSAGILFTGNDYSNFANFAKATNLQILSERNFTSTQEKKTFSQS